MGKENDYQLFSIFLFFLSSFSFFPTSLYFSSKGRWEGKIESDEKQRKGREERKQKKSLLSSSSSLPSFPFHFFPFFLFAFASFIFSLLSFPPRLTTYFPTSHWNAAKHLPTFPSLGLLFSSGNSFGLSLLLVYLHFALLDTSLRTLKRFL